ncbi:MAG: peptidase [Firmicutes bacterium]|nr:peptidase [Bacillota bacterium]
MLTLEQGRNDMRKIELLAPAGSMESLQAAVQSGADAVYMGGNKFSARAYASNFDNEKMAEAVRYCHIYGVKVHVTINTLLKDSEIGEAVDYAKFLHGIGVDALIIQDTGLAKRLKEELGDFELHASTQMTVHNAEGALFLKDLGFKRIVLSRELSLKEIKEVSQSLASHGLETEMFIHGALCICYSGQCLMSSMIGGRSGNRGRCAQTCRLPYTLTEDSSGDERQGYLLSPKDICTLDVLREIYDTGVASLKIEGRMKRPEYVAGVVGAYRKALDSLYKGNADFGLEKEQERVLQLFNRGGASKAYMFGNVGRDMMAYSNPKNTGLELGRADAALQVRLMRGLSVKDGLSFGEEGFSVSKIIMDGQEVQQADKGDLVKIFPQRYRKGDVLYKTSDSSLLEELEEVCSQPYLRKIDVPVEVAFRVSKPVEVAFTYKGTRREIQGPLVQEALKKPLAQEKFIENMTKTQNTPFNFIVSVVSFEDGFIPVSSINEIRRDILSQIDMLENVSDMRTAKPTVETAWASSGDRAYSLPGRTMAVVSTMNQFRAATELGISDIAVDLFNMKSDLDIDEAINLRGECTEIYLRIPNIIKEEFEAVCSFIDANLAKVEGLLTGNLGIMNRYRGKTSLIGDYKLNIFNREALDFYNSRLDLSCLSVELNRGEIKDMIRKRRAQVLVYGKTELMVSEYCMTGSLFGNKSKDSACSRPCLRSGYTLKDRKGVDFNVETDRYCRSHIYNSVPINLIPNLEDLGRIGAKHFRLDFIDESYGETKNILESFAEGRFEGSFENYTRGHYKRGVE